MAVMVSLYADYNQGVSTWQTTLENLIRPYPVPRLTYPVPRLIVRGTALDAWAETLSFQHTIERVEAPPADLALLGMPDAGLAEIALLRDRCPRVVVLVESLAGPDFNEFLALGFERLFASPDGTAALYCHDIATYKTVPDWLNAKYWAHPERWEL